MRTLTTILAAIAVVCLAAGFSTSINSKDLVGAWGYDSPEARIVMIFTDKVFSVATYDIPGKKFISSYGGTWRIDNNKTTQKIEWNSLDSSQVGKEVITAAEITDDKLIIRNNEIVWTRLDDGKPGALMGAWIITGNFRNDTASKRANPFYPRRTMKVLSGKYFHWIAYNVGTKSFQNAGGGTYTTANGKYTENIEFFTKTSASVGKTLVFDYSFVNGDWRHKGEKSTGGAMDECWTRREKFE